MGGAIGAFIAFGTTYGKEASGTLAPSTYWGRFTLVRCSELSADLRSFHCHHDCWRNHRLVLSTTLAGSSI